MKNTKNPMKRNKNVNPEFVVIYEEHDYGQRGIGNRKYDVMMLVTREELDKIIAVRGTEWIKKIYKLGNEVKINNKIEYVGA